MAYMDIPNVLIWALLVAVIVQGFSMGLLVYLMIRRARKENAKPTSEEKLERETIEEG